MSVNERRNPDASVSTPLRLQTHFHLGVVNPMQLTTTQAFSPQNVEKQNTKDLGASSTCTSTWMTGQSHHQRYHGAQGCPISGIVTTCPVLFSIRGSDFGTLQESEHCFTLSHNLECSSRIIGLIKH